MPIELIPIQEHLHQNEQFAGNANCAESLAMCIDFYKRVGFNPPWICYYVQMDGNFVAAAAFKGQPVGNKVEIAYGTFPQYQNQGIATKIVSTLVKLALNTHPTVG